MSLPRADVEAAVEPSDYEADFAAWSFAQAELIRAGRFGEADLANVAEEIESLGREQFSKLASAFEIVLIHILKWDQQPERRSRSWSVSISTHRTHIQDVLDDNPSLRRRQPDAVYRAYRLARLQAADQTGLPTARFPTDCPYTLNEILNLPFPWPED